VHVRLNRRKHGQRHEECQEDVEELRRGLLEDLPVGHVELLLGVRFLFAAPADGLVMAEELVQRQRKVGVEAEQQHKDGCDEVVDGRRPLGCKDLDANQGHGGGKASADVGAQNDGTGIFDGQRGHNSALFEILFNFEW